ncbi:MAG TPA: VWA domain-containing protein [Methanomicrobiales archaeon]|nr:VWA domain-containing protein [Methanomicrobiales archaeon]
MPAAALDPVNVRAVTGKEWVIADAADSSPVTITVTDGTNKPIAGAEVRLTLDQPAWSLKDTVLGTDATGTATTLFLPTTKSGSTTITASVTVKGTTVPVTATVVQRIDAGSPYIIKTSYPCGATVASTQKIIAGITDRYGNPVTSLRLPNKVSFTATTGGSGGFLDGSGNLAKAADVLMDETGNATALFRLDTKAGDNFVMIVPPVPLAQSLIAITGIGDSMPFSILQSVSPPGNPPYVMADGLPQSQATIDYYLYDEWGNPSTGQNILITTSAAESRTFTTNGEGRVTMVYGPKLTAGFYTITATAAKNESVRVSQLLQFVSGSPKDMILTASPQTMASSDVNPSMVGSVIAKVIDEKGNPVKGETVSFIIEKAGTAYPSTMAPAIEGPDWKTDKVGDPVTIVTDTDGQAILSFYPGAFPKPGEAGWNANAQGSATISATWKGADGAVTREIGLSYKNYPFLSVYTDVIPKTVQVGGAVDVSVRLVGDGWALQPKPIDVILCTDRSATMLYNESIAPGNSLVVESQNDRMVDAMNAATTFVGQTSGQDRIGLVTFGDPADGLAILYDTGNPATHKDISPYGYRAGRDFACDEGGYCKDTAAFHDTTDDKIYVNAHYPGHGTEGKDYKVNGVMTGAYVESSLTYDKTQITKAINSVVPAGGTPMRRAIYESVKQITNDPEVLAHKRDGAVRAIILLTDGKWNLGGDPRGLVSSVFSIEAYPEVAADLGGLGTGSVITWAKDNDIKIFTIALVGTDTKDQPNTAELQAYADETGGKAYVASSGLDLKQIYIDIAGALREEASIDTQVALDFGQIEVNDKENVPGDKVFEYMYRGAPWSTYVVPPAPAAPEVRDDTTAWENNQNLAFSPGTIKVNQEWRVNFTLMALTEGNIKLLSSKTSHVTFVGTEGSVDIPDTFITAIPPGTEKGPEALNFKVKFDKDHPRLNEDTDTKIAMMQWHVTYDGNDNLVSQTIWVAPANSEAYQYKDTVETPRAQDTVVYPLIISDLRPGIYKVKVVGHVSDATDSPDFTTINIPTPIPNKQILIQ